MTKTMAVGVLSALSAIAVAKEAAPPPSAASRPHVAARKAVRASAPAEAPASSPAYKHGTKEPKKDDKK
jgi:hypothetical protein